MLPPGQGAPIKVYLAADIRFVKPDVVNDHVWALETSSGDPAALSLFTTYGLRSRRMRVFPRFKFDNFTATNPALFYKFPSLQTCSTNACTLQFFPFQNVDVQLKLWVPTSQIIVGQMCVFNAGIKSISLGIDWLIQMNPHGQGIPMTPRRIGMNQVLHGETENLHPLFYLTGGPEESASEYPGLGINLHMVPDSDKQVTWVLSSLDSIDSSFFYARQYSSKILEIELVKNEITDQFQKISFSTDKTEIGVALSKAQNRAFQLVIPPIGFLRHDTFIQDRNPDTGYFFKTETMDLSRDWAGQTTLDAWYLAQFLLPGRAEVLKCIVQNFLDAQEPDGFIDFRVSVNHRKSGILATPVLISLIDDLYPYLNDHKWLSEIFPSLVLFLKKWQNTASDHSKGFSVDWHHPIQTGINNTDEFDEDELIQFWVDRKSGQDVYLASLLFHEAKSLMRISSILGYTQENDWLHLFMSNLRSIADSFLEKIESGDANNFKHESPGRVIGSFKKNGNHFSSRKITRPGRLLLKVIPATRISPTFTCQISGLGIDGDMVSEEINSKDLIVLGKTCLFTTKQSYLSLSNILVSGLQKGDFGEVSKIEPAVINALCFLLLWSGMYTKEELSKLEITRLFLDYVQQDGIHLKKMSNGKPGPRVPNAIATLLIQGLIQNNYLNLASQAYLSHFFSNSTTTARSDPTTGRLELLPPVRLFLELLGLRKLSNNELVISHLNPLPWPVMLSFNQVRIITGNEGTEIFTRKGDTIKITEGQPQRILLD